MSAYNNKLHSKISMDGVGGGGHTYARPNLMDKVANADFVFAVSSNGEIDIIKNRYNAITGKSIPMDTLLELFSLIISKGVFKENLLKMFTEGLSLELENSMKKTIEKFHKGR